MSHAGMLAYPWGECRDSEAKPSGASNEPRHAGMQAIYYRKGELVWKRILK